MPYTGHLGWDCPAGFPSVHTPVMVELCQSAKMSWEKNKRGPQGSGLGRRANTQAPPVHFAGSSVAPVSVGAITVAENNCHKQELYLSLH